MLIELKLKADFMICKGSRRIHLILFCGDYFVVCVCRKITDRHYAIYARQDYAILENDGNICNAVAVFSNMGL